MCHDSSSSISVSPCPRSPPKHLANDAITQHCSEVNRSDAADAQRRGKHGRLAVCQPLMFAHDCQRAHHVSGPRCLWVHQGHFQTISLLFQGLEEFHRFNLDSHCAARCALVKRRRGTVAATAMVPFVALAASAAPWHHGMSLVLTTWHNLCQSAPPTQLLTTVSESNFTLDSVS
jgi:hypothetical protein